MSLEIESLTFYIAMATLIATIGFGVYQLHEASLSRQINTVTTIVSLIDASLGRMIGFKNTEIDTKTDTKTDDVKDESKKHAETLMNAFDLYALLVRKRLIRKKYLREYMEESYPLVCEDAMAILHEDEFKKRYQNAYALYEELKDRPRKKRLSFLMKFEVFSKRYLLPVPISRFQDTHRRAASLHSMVLMPAASEFVMFLLA